MNVISFLIQDGDSFVNELNQSLKSFSPEGLLERIKFHIAHFELYETIENQLLTKVLEHVPPNATIDRLTELSKKTNQRIWSLFETMIDSVHARRLDTTQKLLCDLYEFFRTQHSRLHLLLPFLVRFLDDHLLEDLGQRAQRYYARFYEPVLRNPMPSTGVFNNGYGILTTGS